MDSVGLSAAVRMFGSTHRYYQGHEALDELPEICSEISAKPVTVVDADMLAQIGDRLARLFDGRPHVILPYRGEVTPAAMAALAAGVEGADIVVGMGGGKALDASKGCAIEAGLRFNAVPTVASNDSPTLPGT